MGLMKKVDIEIRNSPALGYLHHELKALRTQVKGLQIIAEELLTAVELKHLDETNPCLHEWHADQDNQCNFCVKCGARQEIYTE